MTEESNWSPLITSTSWRFTLRQLLVGIAIIAAGLVALRNASGAWAAALLAVALLTLAMSVLLVIYRRGAARAFWLGFAIFGWLYLLLLMLGNFATGEIETLFRPSQLATTRLSNACYHWMFDKAFEQYRTQYPVRFNPAAGLLGGTTMSQAPWPPPGAPPLPGPDEQSFANVAHSLWALLLAVFGGIIARWLYRKNEARLPTHAAPPTAG